MRLTENTRMRIRVPKRLYEAIQEEMNKKEMEEDVDYKGLSKQYGMNGGYPLDYFFKVSEDLMDKGVELETLKSFIQKTAAGKPATLGSRELDSTAKKLVDSIKYMIATGDSPKDVAARAMEKAEDAYEYFDNAGAGLPGTEEDWQDDLQEASIVSDPNFIAGLATLLGVGGTLAASLVKDLRKAKTPEEKKAAKQKMASAIQGQMGGSMEENKEVEEIEEAIDLETLMEAIKDAKKKKAEEKKKKEAEAKKKKEAEAKKKALAAKKK